MRHDGSATRICRIIEGEGGVATAAADAEEDLLAARLARLHLAAELRTPRQPGREPIVIGVPSSAAGGAEVDDRETVGGFEAVDVAEKDGGNGVVRTQLGERRMLGR
ncbi:hypothetical protein SLS55_000406 [Diplodia seriata]|uniref:Uncharacterized protein n=1 Tax=Diplodia seriata TaxID=420778 RepID=A0ABR3CU81_9PEZI